MAALFQNFFPSEEEREKRTLRTNVGQFPCAKSARASATSPEKPPPAQRRAEERAEGGSWSHISADWWLLEEEAQCEETESER